MDIFFGTFLSLDKPGQFGEIIYDVVTLIFITIVILSKRHSFCRFPIRIIYTFFSPIFKIKDHPQNKYKISTNKYKISTNVKIFKNENKDQKTNKDHKTVFPPSPKIKDRTLFQEM